MQLGAAKQTLSQYWQEVRHYPLLWIPLVVLVPTGVFLINYAQPYIVAEAIDRLSTETVPVDQVWAVFGSLIVMFILAAVIGEVIVWRLIVWLIWNLEKRIVFKLYQRSFSHLSAQSTHFHASRMSGSLVSQVNKYTSSYVRLADTFIFNILPLASALAFTFILLVPRAPALFTAGLAILCIAFMGIALMSFKKIRHLNEREAEANNRLSGLLSDMVTNIIAVKSFGQEREEVDRFQAANATAQSRTHDVIKAVIIRDIRFGSVLVMISIFMFVTLVYGPAAFGISIGTLVLMSTYSFAIFNRLWNFNGILRDVNRALGDAATMTAVVDTDIDVKDPVEPKPLIITKGEVVFDDISFAHPDDKKDVLFSKLSLHIKPGEKIGLVGHSGSGKTTLTKLLLRFMDTDTGQITIDGQDIKHVAQADLRQQVAYVPQEPLLFHRTLGENIAYAKPSASLDEIRAAADKANALDFIDRLPHGLNTMVGERGVKLSGGQRQRIAIARAIMKDSPILILDEATSALDSESEKLIQQALEELMKNRTAIVIAHRLSTIQRLDRIVVMEAGRIIEDGSHEQLLSSGGVYAQLWRHQSGGLIEQ